MGDKSVWVIEEGSYSDYKVVGVYSTKEAAEEVCGAIAHREYNEPTVSEWPLNPFYEELRQGLSIWLVHMLQNGDFEHCGQQDLCSYNLSPSRAHIWRRTQAPAYIGKGIPDLIVAEVWARDKEHAVKITNDMRAQFIASGEWTAT